MDHLNASYEPMDIDLSAQSVKEMDVSYGDSAVILQSYMNDIPGTPTRDSIFNTPPDYTTNTSDYTNAPVVKKYHIIKEKPRNTVRSWHIRILCAFLVLLLSTITYHVFNTKCSEELNITSLEATLNSNIFGQSKAITTLVKELDRKVKSKIIFFYGGTGVGKTFTSSILLEALGLSSNVYHYTMPSFTSIFSMEDMFGLTLCHSSLIIVDDLTLEDMQVVQQITELITKAQNLQKTITVILIFNCHSTMKELHEECNERFEHQIMDRFSAIQAYKSFVKFETLTQTHLRQCIKWEVGGKKLNEYELDNIMHHFNVTHDGCKGVHSKMKYLSVI